MVKTGLMEKNVWLVARQSQVDFWQDVCGQLKHSAKSNVATGVLLINAHANINFFMMVPFGMIKDSIKVPISSSNKESMDQGPVFVYAIL